MDALFTSKPPHRYVTPAMRTFLAFLLVTLAGCALVGDDGPVTLDGAYTDYNAFLNAELAPFPPFSSRFIHFENTRYVLSSRVDCQTLPVDTVSTFELLELEQDVDVEAWIRFHHADFGNEYSDVEPKRHALLSGTVRLADIRVEQEERSYGPDETIRVDVVYYRLEAQRLSFAQARVPSLKTEEHPCFVGDGFGGEVSP